MTFSLRKYFAKISFVLPILNRLSLVTIRHKFKETRCHFCCNGLFTLPDPDSDPYSDSDSCTMQKFHIGSDPDSDPLIEMYGIGWRSVPGTDICP